MTNHWNSSGKTDMEVDDDVLLALFNAGAASQQKKVFFYESFVAWVENGFPFRKGDIVRRVQELRRELGGEGGKG